MDDRELHNLTNVEIEKSARLLIVEYGVAAEDLAEMRINEMLNIKNPAGVVAWGRILDAIRQIRQNEARLS